MNMFKDTVKDAVILSFAEARPTFGAEEQYISGVCAYWLLKKQTFYHCRVRLSSRFLQEVSGMNCVGYW